MKFTRRDVLKISGTTAVALAACGPNVDTQPVSTESNETAIAPTWFDSGADIANLEESKEFPLSVSAGELQPHTATLWTRYTGNAQVSLYVWRSDNRAIVWKRRVVTFASGFAHESVASLTAGRRYSYAFVVGGKRSAVGQFRAAIAEDALETVTFMGYACTHTRKAPFPALSHAAQRTDLDFWVCGGDKVYCDELDGTPKSYQDAYAGTYKQDGYMQLHPSAGMYGIWDDHEFDAHFVVTETPAWVTQLAKQTYFDHHPMQRPANDRMWRSFRWGKTLELFILDCRTERDKSTDTYISRAQMDWLKQSLKDSPCVFKMIVNSVPIGDFPIVFDVKAYDRWTGFKLQRNEILQHINESNIRDVWWLSGDFHFGSVGKVDASGPTSLQREVLWGPGGNRGDPLYLLLKGSQWDFSTAQSNYTVLSCNPIEKTVKVSVVSDEGETLFEQTYESVA